MATINQDDVIKILKTLGESEFDELHLEMGELRLIVKKYGKPGLSQEMGVDLQGSTEPTVLKKPSEVMRAQEAEATIATPPVGPAQEEESIVSLEQKDLIPIKSPMLGTFYRAPKPGAPPFVEVGQFVTESDTVCICLLYTSPSPRD